MSEREVKMVLVIQNGLGMRKGKVGAQCGHAVEMWRDNQTQVNPKSKSGVITFTKEQLAWLQCGKPKITVKVPSEEALLEVLQKAREAGLVAHLVVDSGKTEFHGEATKTCVAIGPNYSDEIDKITGELELL